MSREPPDNIPDFPDMAGDHGPVWGSEASELGGDSDHGPEDDAWDVLLRHAALYGLGPEDVKAHRAAKRTSKQQHPRKRVSPRSQQDPAVLDAFVAGFDQTITVICQQLEEALTALKWAEAVRIKHGPACSCSVCSAAGAIRSQSMPLRAILARVLKG